MRQAQGKPSTAPTEIDGSRACLYSMDSSPKTRSSDRQSARYQPLLPVLGAACCGIVADRFLTPSIEFWWGIAVLLLACWWACWRHEKLAASAGLLLAASAATFAAWHHFHWSLLPRRELGLFSTKDPRPVCVRGTLVGNPHRMPAPRFDPLSAMRQGDRTRVEIAVSALRDGDRWWPIEGRTTALIEGHLLGVHAGDRVHLVGQLSRISPPDNPGEADRQHHYRADGIHATLFCETPECVVPLDSPHADRSDLIARLRAGGEAMLWHHLDPKRAGLAAAMFLGIREELDPDAYDAFLETGTIHLLVVSGMNVAILAGFLVWASRFGWLPDRWTTVGIATVAVVYALLTDAQPPVVRAAVVVVASCLARWCGVSGLPFNTLALAALFVLILNPAELFRAGMQLSFLSFAVLMWAGRTGPRFAPRDALARLIAETRPWPWRIARSALVAMARAVFVSSAIWLAVLPLVLGRFHLVTPVAIFLGPLLALPTTLSMLFGCGVMLFGAIPALGSLCGWICDLNLRLLLSGVELGHQLPGSHFWSPGPSDVWLSLFYLGLIGWLVLPHRRPRPALCLSALLVWVALGFGQAILSARPNDQLRCTFLSVGHGTAVVLELPGGQTLLYDAGRLGSAATGARQVSEFLWRLGRRRLDGVILSHADLDHFNAVPRLLDRFAVRQILVSPVMFDTPQRALSALEAAIVASGVERRVIWSGDQLESQGCRLSVLHPGRTGVIGSDNANSIVLNIEYRGRRILLAGDLEPPGLNDLLAETPLHCDVLMAPHHGSTQSDPPGMAAWSTPDHVVVSGSRRDRSLVVLRAFSRRGSQWLHTAECGAVSVVIDGANLKITTGRSALD